MRTRISAAFRASWGFLRRYYAVLLSAAILAMIARGLFEPKTEQGIAIEDWALILLAAVCVILLLKLILYFRRDDKAGFRTFELGMISAASINMIVQISSGVSGDLYPLNYLLISLIVAFSSMRMGLLFAIILATTEIGRLFQAGVGAVGLLQILQHLFFMILFCLGVGVFLKLERDSVLRAEAVLTKLRHDAADLAGRAGTHDELASLSRDEKDRTTVRNVFTLDEELYAVIEISRRVFGAHSAVLLLLDPDDRTMRVRVHISDSDAIHDLEPIKTSSSALSWVLKQGTHLTIPDLRDSDQLGYYKRRQKVRSALAAPVAGSEGPIGILAVDSLESAAYDRHDGRVLSRFAQLISQSMDRAKSMAELQSERSEFAALHKMSERLTSSLELSDLGRIVLESAREILDFDSAALVLKDETTGEGFVEAAQGSLPEGIIKVRFGPEEGLVGWSVDRRQFLSYQDFREWERSQPRRQRKPLMADGVRVGEVGGLMCIPLIHKDKGIGALVLIWKEARSFTDFEKKIMSVFADQFGQALVNARMYLRMEQMATTDGLTGLANHRVFQEFLNTELERAERIPARLSLVMIDIDHFKRINDTHGHPVGDQVLKALARLLRESVRRVDMAARYGGEEFTLVLINTDSKGAVKFGERLRKAVSAMRIQVDGQSLSITVSMGIACYPEDAYTNVDLVELADEALYHSKESGRDRVTYVGDIKEEAE